MQHPYKYILIYDRRGDLVVRASASRAEGRGFDPWPRQTKVFKTGSSGLPPWRSGLWVQHYDWPVSVKIMDWLSIGKK